MFHARVAQSSGNAMAFGLNNKLIFLVLELPLVASFVTQFLRLYFNFLKEGHRDFIFKSKMAEI